MLCQKEHENRPPPDTADCHRRRPAPLTDIVNQTAHRHTAAQPTAAQPAGVRPHRGKHTAVRQAPSATVVTISTSQPAAVIITTSVQIRRHTTAHPNATSAAAPPPPSRAPATDGMSSASVRLRVSTFCPCSISRMRMRRPASELFCRCTAMIDSAGSRSRPCSRPAAGPCRQTARPSSWPPPSSSPPSA